MCALPNGNIVSAGEDRYIKLWNVKTGNMIRSFIGHDDFVRCLELDKDNRLVSASDDLTIRIWDLDTGEEVDLITGFTDYIYGLACKKNGHIIAGCRDGILKVFDPLVKRFIIDK